LYQSAVIDNASLIYLSHLHKGRPFFHYLKSLFHTVYFPSEIVKEYARGAEKEPHRDWIIKRLKPEQGFYRYCATYDSIVMAMIQHRNGIDKGEAEAYAQLKKVNAHLIISDDRRFTAEIKKLDGTVRVYNTIHLVCWLDMLGFIPNWQEIIVHLYNLRNFTSKELRTAYIYVAAGLGIGLEKSALSKKCSLSKLLK